MGQKTWPVSALITLRWLVVKGVWYHKFQNVLEKVTNLHTGSFKYSLPNLQKSLLPLKSGVGLLSHVPEFHHHHHHDAKRSAVAFRRCDLSPKRAVFYQLQSVGHWYSCVPADLMDPDNGRSTASAFPIRRWSGTVLGFAASPKDLVCRARVWVH